MLKIFLETGKKSTSEYVFIKHLVDVLNVRQKEVEIECVDGWTNLPRSANQFRQNTLEEGTNIIVFDADTPDKEFGGFQQRTAKLQEYIHELDIQAELFLFPRNQDDGMFEDLLFMIAKRVQHQRLFDCFRDYEQCLGREYETPNIKGKMYTYISSMKLSNKERHNIGKGEWLFDNPNYWDIDSEDLQPLKDFLNRYL